MKTIFVIIVHVFSVMFSGAAIAEAPAVHSIERAYEVSVLGHRIGTIDVVRERIQVGETTVNNQRVAVDFGFEDKGSSYSITVQSRIAYDDSGLRDYSHRIRENDEHFTIVGRRFDDELRVQAEQLREGARRNKELADMVIPLARFDLSSEELYDALSSIESGSGELQLRVFNTETLEIETTSVEVLREDSERVGDRVHRCVVVKLESKNNVRTACIARDALGGYLVTETGRDQDGPYRVTLID